jgi:hypothetical protein
MKPLEPYDDATFARLHSAGSGVITASQVPAIFGVSPWSSRYAMAAHVSGKAALTEPSHGRLELGRRLERVGIDIFGEERGVPVAQVRAFAKHDWLPLLASPDGVFGWLVDSMLGGSPAWDDPDSGIQEVKLVAPRRWREEWNGSPPLYVQLQHQTQFACTKAERGAIVCIVVGDFDFFVQIYDTAPHAGAIARIEREVQSFMGMLQRGEMPEPDDQHESTMDALAAIFAPDEAKAIRLDEPEAAERFERWRQATMDRLAAEATEKACKHWFAARAFDAARILVGNSAEITRKQSKVKASVRLETVATRWSLKDHAEDAT